MSLPLPQVPSQCATIGGDAVDLGLQQLVRDSLQYGYEFWVVVKPPLPVPPPPVKEASKEILNVAMLTESLNVFVSWLVRSGWTPDETIWFARKGDLANMHAHETGIHPSGVIAIRVPVIVVEHLVQIARGELDALGIEDVSSDLCVDMG